MSLALALLLSCAADPPIAGPRDVDPPARDGATAPGLLLDGDVAWMSWLEPSQDGVAMKISRYDGRWDAPRTVVSGSDLLVNFADFPGLARGGDGALYAWWLVQPDASAFAYELHMGRSEDQGEHWQKLGPIHPRTAPTEYGFPSAVPTDDGLLVSWLDGRDVPSGGPMTLRSRIVSTTLGPEQQVDPRVCDCCGTDTAVSANGPLLVYRDRRDDERRDNRLMRWTDGQWQDAGELDDSHWQVAGCPVNGPRIEAEGDHLAVGWYTGGADPAVRVTLSSNGGDTWSPPVRVGDDANPTGRLDVALDGEQAVVSWLGEGDELPLYLQRVSAAGRVSEPHRVTTLPATAARSFPRMVRLEDALLVAWTQPGDASRIRARHLPLSSVPAPSRPPRAAPERPRAPARTALPRIEGLDPDGSALTLHGTGGPVLVHLWASWCGPCLAELPGLGHLPWKGRQVGIAIDDRPERVQTALQQAGSTLPTLLLSAPEARKWFGSAQVPSTWIFDREGAYLWHHIGAIDANDPSLLHALERARE